MKPTFFITAFFAVFLLTSAEPDLLFKASYDSYSQHADFAGGDKKAYGFPAKNLQLNGVQGISGTNGLPLNGGRRIFYSGDKNFHAPQGTISFWVQMVNYTLANNKAQNFIKIESQPAGWRWPANYSFFVGKNTKQWKHFVIAGFYYKTPQMKKPVRSQVQFYTGERPWRAGTWHHIALTWDKKHLSLYLDGVLHKALSSDEMKVAGSRKGVDGQYIPWDHPTRHFRHDVHLPPMAAGSKIYLGDHRSASRGDRTAYDDVRIYSRPLSAVEIRKMYEKVVPSVKKSVKNFAGIPWTTDKNKALLCHMAKPFGKAAFFYDARAKLRRDDKNLYVDFYSDRICKNKKYTRQDDPLWEDDAFELHLQSPAGTYYQFIINGNGAVFDHRGVKDRQNFKRQFDQKWNARGMKVRTVHTPKGWRAETVIPLDNFDKIDGLWQMDLCISCKENGRHGAFVWDNVKKETFEGFFASGDMAFLPKGIWGTPENIGELTKGQLALGVRGPKGLTAKASYTGIEGKEEYRGDLFRFPWNIVLPPGDQSLDFELKKGRTLIYRYHRDYYVDLPLEVAFNTKNTRQKIQLFLNFSNAGSARLARLKKEGLKGRALLVDPRGKILSKTGFTARSVHSTFLMDFPKGDLRPGTCFLDVKVSDMHRRIAYRIPDMRPYRERVAVDHTVPKPWTPVRILGGHKFGVWDRVYEFDGKSPFIRQITSSRKGKLLSKPVTLSSNGKKGQWQPWKMTKKFDDHLVFESRGKIAGVPVKCTSELWFDGAYIMRWHLAPEHKTLLRDVKITYQMPEKHARFVMEPQLVRWKNNKAEARLISNAHLKTSLFWLSGHASGMAFLAESNANWVNKKGEAPLAAERKGKFVDVTLKIISRPAELTKKAEYVMVFQGTPARPFPEKFRGINQISYGRSPLVTYEYAGTGSWKNEIRSDDPSVCGGAYPRSFKDFPRHWGKARYNSRDLMYTVPQLSDYAPDFDYFDKDELLLPEATWTATKFGVKQTTYHFCPNVNTTAADLWSWWCDDAMKKLPTYGGLSFDLSGVRYCVNRKHGCAGIDAFGQEYVKNTALGLRDFYLRCYKVCSKRGGFMRIHDWTAYVPMSFFCDTFLPGEETYDICRKNINWCYIEDIPLELYQSEYNQFKAGVSFQFGCQMGRVPELIGDKAFRKRVLADKTMALHAITPAILHDMNLRCHDIHYDTVRKLWRIRKEINIGEADEFHAYWEKNSPFKTPSPRLFVSYYLWNKKAPYRCVAVVANMSRTEQPAALAVDFKKLGLEPGKVRLFDLWNNKELKISDLKNYRIRGGEFLKLGIRKK